MKNNNWISYSCTWLKPFRAMWSSLLQADFQLSLYWRLKTETFCRGWVELLVVKICSTCLSHTSFYWDYKHSWKSLFSAEFHSRKHTEYSCGSQIDNRDRFEQFVQLTLVQFRCTHVFQYMLLSLLRTIPVTVPLNETFFWSQWASFIDISRICQYWQL